MNPRTRGLLKRFALRQVIYLLKKKSISGHVRTFRYLTHFKDLFFSYGEFPYYNWIWFLLLFYALFSVNLPQ